MTGKIIGRYVCFKDSAVTIIYCIMAVLSMSLCSYTTHSLHAIKRYEAGTSFGRQCAKLTQLERSIVSQDADHSVTGARAE